MNWYVIVDSAVVLTTSNEALARSKAEQCALAGGTAVLAKEEGTCKPAPKAPTWS